MSKITDEDYLRIIFICKFCSAPHIYPNSVEWIHKSKLNELLSGPTYQCPGNQERLLAPHFEIQETIKVIDQYDILSVQIMTDENIQIDEQILINDESEEFFDGIIDEQIQIDTRILMDVDYSDIPLAEPMKFTHGDADISKMQIQLGPTIQNLSMSDAKAMSLFVENYSGLYSKAKQSDPELSDEISKIIVDFSRMTYDEYSVIKVPNLIDEFTKKNLEPHFGEYIRNNFEDYSGGVTYSQLPVDIDDKEWEHIVHGVSWSWREVVWLVRWSNVQLHTPFQNIVDEF